MSAARTEGGGCTTIWVDLPGTANNLKFSSDAVTRGSAFVMGQGANRTITAANTGVTFQANHDLGNTALASVQVFLHIAGSGAIPGGTYIGAPSVAITNAGPGLNTYAVSLSSFTIGGTVAAGTMIDGYSLSVAGAIASDMVIDNLVLLSSPLPPQPTPDPTPFPTPIQTPAPTPVIGVVLDDFTTVDPGGSVAQTLNAGCNGPDSVTNTGTNIMGAAASGSRVVTAASGVGSGCVAVRVDVPGSAYYLQFSSDASTQGFAGVSGQGASYTIAAADTAVTFQANHDRGGGSPATVEVLLHIAGTGTIPGGTYVAAPAVSITNAGPGFNTYVMPLSSFTIGGTLVPGNIIDGYALAISGATSSDLVLDNLLIVRTALPPPPPTPTPTATPPINTSVVLDDFTSVNSGGSTAQNVAAGCGGPSSVANTGTNIMGSAATGNRTMNAERGFGPGCISVQVDVPNTANNVLFKSDATTLGFGSVTGQGASFVIPAANSRVTFQANHDLGSTAAANVQVLLHVAGTGTIPGGTFIGGPSVRITNVGPGFNTYEVNLNSFTTGGTINPGTVIDGYGLVFAGAAGSDITVDNLLLVSSTLPTPSPTPTPTGTPVPTPTPTPIASPTPLANILFDGGFESSLGTYSGFPDIGWQITDRFRLGANYNYTNFCAQEICGGQNLARTGTRWLEFGDALNTDPVTMARVEQTIKISPGFIARMDFSSRWKDIAPSRDAYLAVFMDNVEVTRISRSLAIESTYTNRTVDLSGWADGSSHRFGVELRSSFRFRPDGTAGAESPLTGTDILLIDDVTLVSVPAGSISGRVTTPAGLGLRNAIVALTDAQGVRRTATTSSFGIYSFENVRSGDNYTIGVSSKRYRFSPRSLLVTGNLSNVDFVGLE